MLGIQRLLLVLVVAAVAAWGHPAAAQSSATLTLSSADGRNVHVYTVAELLADGAVRDVTIAPDPHYGRAMTFKAIPLAHLLRDLRAGPEDYIQVQASDGFSTSIPARLLTATGEGGTEAFLAVEAPDAKWPVLPIENRKTGPGPFYLVWHTAPHATVSTEYWPFWVSAITVTDSPYKRWPGLNVAADVPAFDPIRRGLDRFAAICMACHRYDGAGDATLGPDLGRPMNPVDYFQPAALRKYIRDPGSLRTWPGRTMPAFDVKALSDADIDAIIAWLSYKARHRP